LFPCGSKCSWREATQLTSIASSSGAAEYVRIAAAAEDRAVNRGCPLPIVPSTTQSCSNEVLPPHAKAFALQTTYGVRRTSASRPARRAVACLRAVLRSQLLRYSSRPFD